MRGFVVYLERIEGVLNFSWPLLLPLLSDVVLRSVERER